ncbi:MAG: hypothetical protein KAR35_10270 [Candidatus Heimdallarchaeota archaeon]|nr:hypothetical protein [Candidatus Heimdallarchaeota archaeon]MCK5049741.1 hypothetical protein [Candidatus Heimdallarchaeota archaeon]
MARNSVTDEIIHDLDISPFSLPFLRDLSIRYVVAISFDLMLGPVAHIKELMGGNVFVERIKDPSFLSEVYAGVARTDINTLEMGKSIGTPSSPILIERHETEDDGMIETTCLLACVAVPDQQDDVRLLMRSVLVRMKHTINKSRDAFQEAINQRKEKYSRPILKTAEHDFTILDEDRLIRNERWSRFEALFVFNYDEKKIDLRNMPLWVGGKNLNPADLINFITERITPGAPPAAHSYAFSGQDLLLIKDHKSNHYLGTLTGPQSALEQETLKDWLRMLLEASDSNWFDLRLRNLRAVLSFIDARFDRFPRKTIGEKMINLILNSHKVYPSLIISEEEFSHLGQLPFQSYFKNEAQMISKLDGKKSIADLATNTASLYRLIEFSLYCSSRHLMKLFTPKA